MVLEFYAGAQIEKPLERIHFWVVIPHPLSTNRNGFNNITLVAPHHTVQQRRLSRYALKRILCIFWNSSSVLHERLLEKSLMVTTGVYNHQLIHVADNYRFHYNKTTKSCGPLVSTRKITRKPFFTLNFENLRHSPYSSGMATKAVY